jgi:anhydro-N-acetylmuramic acid kinase
MQQKRYSLIGLMSGTSGDGLDIAYCQFEYQSQWQYEILLAETVPFTEPLGQKLVKSHLLSGLELASLDLEFGRWMGEVVQKFCRENQLKPVAVASHGHTVFHQPSNRLTLQIGNGWALHAASGEKVITDFRMLDVQLGGQGAPLVPIGDTLLFPKVDFCINLGGISNISMDVKGKRIAFDMSPFNLLLNEEAKKLGRSYDENGNWAREGQTNPLLLSQLNALPFYKNQTAKSLGREDMERDFIPLLENSGIHSKDKLSTLVDHYAFQIASTIKTFQSNKKPSVLITGGGAYNQYFIERLDHFLHQQWTKIEASQELIEFKEALIFAFLGALRLRGEVNSLASVTGASRDSCGGVIYG